LKRQKTLLFLLINVSQYWSNTYFEVFSSSTKLPFSLRRKKAIAFIPQSHPLATHAAEKSSLHHRE
jgi:hypothetical protein